ncbi:MAG TPA: outer membrane beta-barrel family protein, partial [Rubricoccaceae bacterium]
LVGATVALYAAGAFVTGAAADTEGAFRIEGVPAGTYRVRLSFVGYVSEVREGVAVQAGQTTDLGAVVLTADAALLGETVVTAERELVEQRADRTVYNVAAQPVTAGGNALDALQTLPSIEVDTEGTLSLRGGQNVAVQINGRPVPVSGAQLAALLRQIPAQTVDRVEVIPNPSAQYEPDGMSGIVNLVLKQNTGRGLSGGATLGGGTAPSAEASGNVAYQRGPWDASGSYGYRYHRFGIDGTSTQVQFLGAGDAAVEQTFGHRNGVGSHLLNGSLDYTPAEGTTVGARGTLGFRGGTADQDVAYVFGPGTAGAAYRTRVTDGDVGGLTADAALTARRETGPGRRLAAEARWTRNDDDRDERFSDAALGAASPSVAWSRASDLVDEGSVQVDAARALGGLQVEAGAKGTRRDIGTARTFSRGDAGAADPGRSGAFSYDESVGAVYAQASRGLGAFQFQAGLRAESAWRNVAPGGGQAPIEDRYASLYPSAFALYTASPGTTVKASTSRRVNRPQAMFLNPTPRFQDTLTVDVGNPALRPEYTMAYELALQYRYVVTVTPFYRRTTDVIRRRTVFDPATGASTGTFQNLDSQDSYGADLTLTPR